MVSSDLRRFSVVLLIVITVVTCGVFGPIWYLMQMKGLNRLNTMVRLKAGPFVFALVATLGVFLTNVFGSEGYFLDLAGSLLGLATSIVLIIQAFRVRNMFHRHYANERVGAAPTLIRPQLSGVATFFFGAYYLQYRVNRLLDARTPGDTVVVDDV